MTHLEALILGIVQGLTEFLPISSSTHLAMTKRLLGIESSESLVYFDLICHMGTLASLLCLLWKDALRILTKPRSIALFALALLPLVPAYFLLKPLRVDLASCAGIFLLCTSALLFLASRPRAAKETSIKWKDVLCIGMAQSLALLPGMSRSGSTIGVARLLGWEWKEAARFSFLLAIPTIVGGAALETLKGGGGSDLPLGICAIGFASSFAVGLASLRLAFWILERGHLRAFAWYCLGAGLLALMLLR